MFVDAVVLCYTIIRYIYISIQMSSATIFVANLLLRVRYAFSKFQVTLDAFLMALLATVRLETNGGGREHETEEDVWS